MGKIENDTRLYISVHLNKYKITHLNRNIAIINIIKLIIITTVTRTFNCVFVKSKEK
jgi:hypothetical protein